MLRAMETFCEYCVPGERSFFNLIVAADKFETAKRRCWVCAQRERSIPIPFTDDDLAKSVDLIAEKNPQKGGRAFRTLCEWISSK